MTEQLKKESSALYYTIGWMSATYFRSSDKQERQGIACMFKDIKNYFDVEESQSLNDVIKQHYGSEQI